MSYRYLSTIAIAISLSAPSQAEFWDSESLPMVLTPARLEQSRNDVPASVSVIDRAMISASGIRKIPELFRLIPGTFTGARDGWNHVVSYHGTNYRESRRMQVLIDGRSVYQAGLATVDWNDIPITIEDIERIEVVRGPSTASYGANAFLGVINIITRHPADTEKLMLTAKRGSLHIEDYRLAGSTELAGGNLRISALSRRDDGFDHKRDSSVTRHDSDNSDLINFRFDRQWRQFNLMLSGGYKDGVTSDDANDFDITRPNSEVEDHFFSAKLAWELSPRHSQHLRFDYSSQDHDQRWDVAYPPEFLGLPASTGDLIVATTDLNVENSRRDAEFQDTMVWSDTVKTVAGIHIKEDRAKSATFYGGAVENSSYQAFTNVEVKLSDHITANIGGSLEHDENVGGDLTPRYSLHYHVQPGQSFRAVYSEAIRTPDLLETSANWVYTGKVKEPEALRGEKLTLDCANGDPNLDPERIRSRELGYFGNFPKLGLQWDVKVFYDSLDDLISDSLSCDGFSPDNDNYLNQRGAETEIDYRPNPDWLVHFAYSYIESKTNRNNERTFTPQNAASLLMAYHLNPRTQLSMAHYYTMATEGRRIQNNEFFRSDIKVNYRLPIADQQIEFSYIARFRHDDNSELLADNIYDEDIHHLLVISFRL